MIGLILLIVWAIVGILLGTLGWSWWWIAPLAIIGAGLYFWTRPAAYVTTSRLIVARQTERGGGGLSIVLGILIYLLGQVAIYGAVIGLLFAVGHLGAKVF